MAITGMLCCSRICILHYIVLVLLFSIGFAYAYLSEVGRKTFYF